MLAWNGVAYRLTDDIAYLVEQLEGAGVQVPVGVSLGETLTPWAAEIRYEEPPEPEHLDRDEASSVAAAAIAWARETIEPNN